MSRYVDARGELRDFIPRPGDPVPTVGRRNDSARQKWGGRYLISNLIDNVGARATVISTGNLILPTSLNVQLRWSRNVTLSGTRQPELPFTYPVHGGVVVATVHVRRSVDPTSPPTQDTYSLGPNDVFPIDMITARELGVDVELPNVGSGSTTWVEAICTPVHDVGPTNKVYPYNVAQNPRFVATTIMPTALLTPNSDRVQFFITNTSTNADLLLQFGAGPNLALPTWAPNPLGTLILPRNQFACYESMSPFTFKGRPNPDASPPIRGQVYGVWSNAGDGGAMIYEGTAF